MYSDERINAYLNSLEKPQDPRLEAVRQQALADGVPIVRPATQSLLAFFVTLLKPDAILEVGTAVGYSALCMREAMPAGGHIITLEKDSGRAAAARKHFADFGAESGITLLEGDAAELLKSIPDRSFSFVFMDAAKGQYLAFLPDVLRVLKTGGMIFSDNVLQDGEVLDSRFAVPRRDRTIHTRMRNYLFALKHMEGVTSSVIPIGDGVCVTVKTADSPDLSVLETMG